MKPGITRLALALTVLAVAAPAAAQVRDDSPAMPTFSELIVVRANVRADFDALVLDYFHLRTVLEEGLPAPRVTDHPADYISIRRTLARRIRAARSHVPFGAIFTSAISTEFRRILSGRMTPATLAAIMDDNPGQFSPRINGTYSSEKPLSTVPGTLLAVLPVLPDGLEYRFVGFDLVLLDTRASVILDRITCAVGCVEVVD
jgi:hypothetical protein